MITIVAFLAAAAAGSLVRADVGRRWNRRYPSGTVMVNVTGAFLLGVLSRSGGPGATVLAVGAIGALTTYSSFARDIVAIVEARRPIAAAVYVGTTLAGGIGAAALGVALA